MTSLLMAEPGFFAASVAATVPIVILVLVFRRSIVSGLTSGAVKG